MKTYIAVLFIIFSGILSGCQKTTAVESVPRMEVSRIFWHEGSRYSFLKETGNGSFEIVSLPQYFCGNKINVTADVPPENPIWVSYDILHGSFSRPNPCLEKLDIHIHSPKEINGGGWDHGKFGKGNTTVIE